MTSLETVMERKYGQARRVWVFDRGIVSDANLAAIRRRGGQYLVGTRRTKLRAVERALLEGTWTQVRDEVDAQLVPIPGGTETYVLCRRPCAARRNSRFGTASPRAWKSGLQRLATRVATGRLKDRGKIERVLGRLQASYPSVADLYEMAVRDEDGRLRLHWKLIEERRAWRDAREGAYLLWVTLKHLLHRRGTGLTPTRALAQLATLQSADIILPTTDGREIRLRRVATPTPGQRPSRSSRGCRCTRSTRTGACCSPQILSPCGRSSDHRSMTSTTSSSNARPVRSYWAAPQRQTT